ncbi:MAG: ribose 5-phosphate isomerase B [Bacteroidetes bacterium]|nr:ribose 5-phosphate isomerase B [Bacteroidota bacterium]MBV6461699.1 Ribose-5-phosphate isomerase B [Flavobacteriales bacterium]WKZ75102.1 MAG: ribose 5-phosphate isomerase B [Vicingaceae bacterium]MCL4815483.1 ribose 5-phosphate isomerase B [Flavobacteriales bacterium]NOG96079.1 ribose 5-phosphate isomerase B [Bacteroidota bacterium]
MKLIIGSDHAGFQLKEYLKAELIKKGFELEDVGTHSEESVDYPDFAHTLALKVENGEFKYGILICGSGNGISMAANKHKGIRSAICWNKELAKLAREHNDANIIALPARFIKNKEAEECVEVFLNTRFEGGRHERRVQKI